MNEQSFTRTIQKAARPLLIEFRADWCIPCRAMQPLLDSAKKRYAGELDILQVDADASPELIRSLGVMGIPTLLYYRNGEQVGRHTGAINAAALERQIAQLLNGERVKKPALSMLDRSLRLGAGLVVAALGFSSGGSNLWLAALGGVIAFTAVYDRCPVYKAVTAQFKRWWQGLRKAQ